ncbi:MAG: cytochrome c3 family protein [Bacillota bacterium]|nr:cytochrome c3 family protein [Bacillota bacterium]
MRGLLLAFVLAAALASPAVGGTIVGSRHDLAWAYHRVSDGFHPWYDYNQVCVFCHTPHHADQTQGALWNRFAPAGPYILYQSPSLDNLPSQPGRGSAVCLSCHDGTLAVDAVLQQPLYTTSNPEQTRHGAMTTAGSDSWLNCGTYCHRSGGSWHDGTRSYMERDLSGDHPVSIAYPSSAEFVPAPPDGRFANGVRLIAGRVECISCHNPHDPTNRPFLVMSDDNSALCYTCHAK